MPEPTYVTIPDLTAAQDAQVNDNMLIEAAVVDQNEQSGYSSRKVTRGQLLSELKEDISELGGLSDDVKQALLQIAAKVAYTDDDGQDYYGALEAALYPQATLVSISAVYTQSGTVYDTDSLDSLKADLVVTAHYDDSTTETVTTYTLSGTLEEGTSTITVAYGGKTTTFNVTVTLSRATRFGTFVNGHAVSKAATGSASIPINSIWISSASARAAFSTPIVNRGYTVTVTDSSKYNLVVYDVADNTPVQTSYQYAIEHVYYAGGTKTISWQTSDSASTPYILISLKKLDNTAFTDAELANGAEAVFTFTESND